MSLARYTVNSVRYGTAINHQRVFTVPSLKSILHNIKQKRKISLMTNVHNCSSYLTFYKVCTWTTRNNMVEIFNNVQIRLKGKYS